MSYDLNPCNACWKKIQNGNGNCNINELNDCLVDTATAFGSFPSNNSMRGTALGENWQECISQKMKSLPFIAGKPRNKCNFNVKLAPRFLQVPHYYPELLEQTQNKETALKMCHTMCENNRLSETCKETCNCDYNAVENFKPSPSQHSPSQHSPSQHSPSQHHSKLKSCYSKEMYKDTSDSHKHHHKKHHHKKHPTYRDEAKAHPAAFWIPFSITGIILSIILVIFITVLFSNKIGKK